MATSPTSASRKAPRFVPGTGRRKSAVALVRLTPGKGEIHINERALNEYFNLASWQDRVLAPLKLISKQNAYNVSIKVSGGGSSSQVGAISLGIARALLAENEELRGSLKKAGLLTRDARQKERRKYGLKKARKAPQFSKR